MRRTKLNVCPWILLCLSLGGCDEKKEPASNESPAEQAGEGSEGTAPSASAEAPSDKAEKKAPKEGATPEDTNEASGSSGADCLAGKWHYDFADQAMETMVSNIPGGKLTKEEGELICEVTLQGKEGSTTCSSAGGKPVIVEVSANQAGMPLVVNVKMTGKSTTKFKLTDDKTMALTSDGLGDLKVEVTATVAGNKIPFPATEMINAFGGDQGATNTFECKGDELRMMPQLEGHKTSWQTLKRMK